MKGTWKAGQAFGIGVFIHWSFLILVAYIFLMQIGAGFGLMSGVAAVVYLGLVFFCVVLHEYGHALTARHYGVGTRHITLYPIGGVAQLESMPRKPIQELLIALAGPAVNLVIASVLGALLTPFLLAGGGLELSRGIQFGNILPLLLFTNILLAVFNMIPAFPMDGGRVFRALLAMKKGRLQATRTAARVGKYVALFMGVFGLMHSPMLVLIAIFVLFAGEAELRMVEMEHLARSGLDDAATVSPPPYRSDEVAEWIHPRHGPQGSVWRRSGRSNEVFRLGPFTFTRFR